MEIGDLQTNWDQLGRTDPFWAILSVPDKINGKWDPQQFFSTGVDEINVVLQYLKSLGLKPVPGNALDFGCGVGRLTQALCRHFKHCCGIDIAPSMIDLATRFNRYGARCRYHLNSNDSLAAFEDNSWDFIYSNLVLQHMKPEYSKRYVREFVRVLSPEGVLLFQIPAEPNHAPPAMASVEKLPGPGFLAAISSGTSTLTAAPGSTVELRMTVKNISSATWPGSARLPNSPIALGNHWLNEAGELLLRDDGRTCLTVDLKPGEEIEMSLAVHTPTKPGNYLLELDMVQEQIAWFVDKGSKVQRIRTRITSDAPRVTSLVEHSEPQARIEMYGVPKPEILEIIAAAGGRVVDVQEDACAGAEWTSYRYCVMKSKR